MFKGIIINVGGSLNPIIHSLNEHRPDCIVFFASSETQPQIVQILDKLKVKPKIIEQIITPKAEDLNSCYRTIKETLPKILARHNLKGHDLTVDFTGGTKAMSAAIVLATIDKSSKYSYIGGIERNKQGLGVVIDGKEKTLYLNNPWDELGVAERQKINNLFNTARYTTAIEVVERLKAKVSDSQQLFYEIFENIIKGYDFWDRFQHRRAREYLNKGLERLKLYAIDREDFSGLVSHIQDNAELLQKMIEDQKERNRLLILDLIGNAKRRAELENKYDDAIARLYRALEKLAQIRLSEKFEIRTSDVAPEKLPANIKDEFEKKYRNQDGKIRIPLEAGYKLLKELNDPTGRKFFEQYNEIRKILNIRNNSILAHGDSPVEQDTYQKMLGLIMHFNEVKEDQLPVFPQLEL